MLKESDGAQSRKGGTEPDQCDSTRKPPETPHGGSMACAGTRKPETASAPFRVKVRVAKARIVENGKLHPVSELRLVASYFADTPAARALRALGLET